MVDINPPIAGCVCDAADHGIDIDFQSSPNRICANWQDFYDPESGIKWSMMRRVASRIPVCPAVLSQVPLASVTPLMLLIPSVLANGKPTILTLRSQNEANLFDVVC
ncbi:uncharacterized protein [Ptychodera flava]|uniref:uncharacterized protein isoform X2 n=1 Tax=Ptychodera flava TaxID=63121 RepID=UPI00396A60BB